MARDRAHWDVDDLIAAMGLDEAAGAAVIWQAGALGKLRLYGCVPKEWPHGEYQLIELKDFIGTRIESTFLFKWALVFGRGGNTRARWADLRILDADAQSFLREWRAAGAAPKKDAPENAAEQPSSNSTDGLGSDASAVEAASTITTTKKPIPTQTQVRDIIRKHVKDRAKEGLTPSQAVVVHLVQGKYRISRPNILVHYRVVTSRDSSHRGYHKLKLGGLSPDNPSKSKCSG